MGFEIRSVYPSGRGGTEANSARTAPRQINPYTMFVQARAALPVATKAGRFLAMNGISVSTSLFLTGTSRSRWPLKESSGFGLALRRSEFILPERGTRKLAEESALSGVLPSRREEYMILR